MDLKFDIVARNIHFDEIHHNIFTMQQIWDGREILTWLKSDNCEMLAVRRCTEVKDRYGKEIFEGDIIELYDGSRYEVGYHADSGMFWLVGLYDRETIGDKASDWDAYIIGNKYDNPRALEVKRS